MSAGYDYCRPIN